MLTPQRMNITAESTELPIRTPPASWGELPDITLITALPVREAKLTALRKDVPNASSSPKARQGQSASGAPHC